MTVQSMASRLWSYVPTKKFLLNRPQFLCLQDKGMNGYYRSFVNLYTRDFLVYSNLQETMKNERAEKKAVRVVEE